MYVYNRWGQLIFHSDNIYEGWDGTYSGNEVQIDTYVYKIYYDVNQPDLPPASLQKVGIVNVLK
jgi:gliding motility-associated-like protein